MSSGSEASVGRPSLREMGAQTALNPGTRAEAEARYFNSANAFNVKLPPVPPRCFIDEARQALADDTPTGWIVCSQSAALGCDFPATTPMMLARYARIRAGESLRADVIASGLVCQVIAGAGHCCAGDETLAFEAGDILFVPGAQCSTWTATADVVLWVVTDEPLYAMAHARPRDDTPGRWPPVHYRQADIHRQVDLVHASLPDADTSGMAVVFSSAALEAGRNILPTLTLSLNSLPPGASQPPHRHNSAALTLVVAGTRCHTRIDGEPCDWAPWATLVTPPGAPHSHHNAGHERALFLIVQDGGLYYHGRTMGFQALA